ncbi:hypothetical protein LEP1GSC193_0829 [Leptospira alstonii serovar Pingchang str. 80-412]|uniref:Uncharacterized protein n=2 Tax=Leptospira alstonii TaxID=28452 RepID=M6CXW6_9LEPT|nr:hypothetical protein LEP1GSC194_3609 [Leptospira alstonii serovar Sichuan str. 79601]EQA80064.1 hypothetical protein LEP1GSC193_0829 [Leptospira alstonii serovar Pingchang str. 80-412]
MSSDLLAQNKIEVQIKSQEKIKHLDIEGKNFSKRINGGSNSEITFGVPDYGGYTVLAENEKGLQKKIQIQVRPGNTSFSIDSEKDKDGIEVIGERRA